MTTLAPALAQALAPCGSGLYRNIWHHARGARARLVGSMSMLLASQMVKLAMPWLAAQAIDALQHGGTQAVARAGAWIAGIVALNVGAWMLHGPGRVLERSVGVCVRRGIADALYAKLARAPLAWHEQRHCGDVQHRVHQASRALSDFAQSQFVYLQNGVNLIGPLIALWLLSGATGAMAMVGYVLVALVIVRFDRTLMRLATLENDAERRYASGLIDFLGNAATVIGLRLQSGTRGLLARRLEAVFLPMRRSIVVNEVKWCAVDICGTALTWALVCVFVWRTQGAGSAVMLGSVFMVYQYAQQAGGVVGSMASNFQNFARIRTDFASADEIVEAPELAPSPRAIDASWRVIAVRDLCFRHGAATAIERGGLRHVSLRLERGERIALVGPSGSGKSTLMRVLAGLYEPQHGHVEVDGVAQFGLHHLGGCSTLIPQTSDVFESSVRENIDFGEPAPQAAFDAALHVSAFDAVLSQLPAGVDTPLTERGSNLSGGQRQRLALARGVLAARDSTLLLLDEPTSALDPLTEALVHERLHAHAADACIVASVHRMGLLRHFDRVVLMDDGRIVDSGSIDELAARQPMFRAMLDGVTMVDIGHDSVAA